MSRQWFREGHLQADTLSSDALLRRSYECYAAVVRAGALVLWRADLSGRMIAVMGWDQLTGRAEAEALDRGYLDGFHSEDRHLLDFARCGDAKRLEAECRVLDRDGHWRWVRGRGVRLPGGHGFPPEWIGTLEDIHEQRLTLDRARFLAERDALTGLGNRRTLASCLAQLRDREASATVVMLDVAGFKAINDQHGHQLGDRFLVRLAQMLLAAASPHSLCACMGGDEFCVVVADRDEAAALVSALNAAGQGGVAIGKLSIPMRVRAGIADADWSEADPASRALRKADLALRRAKATGKSLVFHDDRMQAQADKRDRLLRDLGTACRNGEMFLEYQCIVDTKTRLPVSYEALLRWQHPQFGRIEPSLFIGLAEENGMIAELGLWVLAQACTDLSRVSSHVRVNLNVSPRQLIDPDFADRAAAVVREHGIAPDRITLELTESAHMVMLADSDGFARLREHGFRMVLDDFGTEYAVLSHISSGQFDGIKLSREFIAASCCDGKARIVTRHMVALCGELGLDVVAEGVETQDERDCLHELGVRQMQGFYYGKPERVRLDWSDAAEAADTAAE